MVVNPSDFSSSFTFVQSLTDHPGEEDERNIFHLHHGTYGLLEIMSRRKTGWAIWWKFFSTNKILVFSEVFLLS